MATISVQHILEPAAAITISLSFNPCPGILSFLRPCKIEMAEAIFHQAAICKLVLRLMFLLNDNMV